jgi:hypothetical protein
MGRDFQIEDPRCCTPTHRASFGQRPAKLGHHWIIHGASAERACIRQLAQSDEGASEIGRFATYYRRNSRIGRLEAPMTLVGKGSPNAHEDAPDATDVVSNR